MDNGRPVKGHKAGDPICPLVQQKRYPSHPRAQKLGYEASGSVASSSSNVRRGRDGKFTSKGKGKGKTRSANAIGTVLAVNSEDTPVEQEDPQENSPEKWEVHQGDLRERRILLAR